MSIIVVTFYKFVVLADVADLQHKLIQIGQAQAIRGTILLAPEGINGTIAGSPEAIDAVINWLRSDHRFTDLEYKQSQAQTWPFDRLKVRIKSEIVTLGLPEVNPAEQVGTYVSPREWNQLITDPEVLVIDTRNQYEVEIGSFQGAINPKTRSFRQFPDYVRAQLDPSRHQKVALFCTGGIRCEKASSFLLAQGFQQVYHLKGGILKYLEDIAPEASLWRGECFVFDQRVALQQGLEEGNSGMCRGCGHPISLRDQVDPAYQEGICCPYCVDQLTEEKLARQQERQRQYVQKTGINRPPVSSLESSRLRSGAG